MKTYRRIHACAPRTLMRSPLAALAALLFGTCAGAASLTPPSVRVMDKFGVNLHNGQVNSTLGTVSIGGAMGLSHSIALYSNHLERSGQRGYIDKFKGAAKYSQLLGANFVWPVMRVYDFSGSVDFLIRVNGAPYTGNGQDSATIATFVALKDERNKLALSGAANEYLDWTKPDGTVSRFVRQPNPWINHEGRLTQVTSPNGFTVYFDFPHRVYTNTGFSIVYQHEQDTRPPDYVADANAPAGAPGYSIAEWALINPRHVKAVNNAVCSTASASCLQRSWPTATFTWPAGMPRTMYVGERLFSVQTPMGTTTYRYKPYDLAYSGNTVVQGYTPGQRISPRLYKIKPASSTTESIEYTYTNLFSVTSVGLRDDLFTSGQVQAGTFPTGMGDYATLIQDAGVIASARLVDEANGYSMGEAYMGEGAAQNLGTLIGGVWRVIMTIAATPPTMSSVDSEDGQIIFEPAARNFPIEIRHNTGVTERFSYSPRGNLDQISANGVPMSRAVFFFENACNTSPKTCNQATSIFDAKNNETKYEYHAESGQVSRIIPPADQNGTVAETRIDYQQLRARYFDLSGNRVEGAPIYMKVAERRCHDSNYTSALPSATCAAGDEIVTRFTYNHNNLLLTSTATTAPDGKTLRTCFQYDVYGNKIGETQPKGATNCN